MRTTKWDWLTLAVAIGAAVAAVIAGLAFTFGTEWLGLTGGK